MTENPRDEEQRLEEELDALEKELESLTADQRDAAPEPEVLKTPAPAEAEPIQPEQQEAAPKPAAAGEDFLFQTNFKPETTAETIRRSGLAYAAAIVLFGSVVFMLILGWFVDLILGTSPWGIVGGVILGSIIGFIQFFRISSQIFKNRP